MSFLVIWTAIKAMFGKLATFLQSLSFWQLASLGLAIFALVQHFELVHARSEAARWQKQYASEHQGRISDREAYTKAQTDAKAANKAQVQQVEQQSKKVSDDERQAYLSDLAKLRAGSVRQQNAGARGASGSAGASAPSAATAGADGDGLQVPPRDDVHEDAAEIELRLMHLQNWVEQQLAIDPNNEAPQCSGSSSREPCS